MFIFFTVLIFIVCILLVLIVLIQNSKGGGLASNFSSAGQFMGVRKTTDFLEKATWTLAGVLVILTIVATATIHKPSAAKSAIEDEVQKAASNPDAKPTFPAADQSQQQQQPADGQQQSGGQQQQPAQPQK
jgi:preprotein translocase subunit SecG